MKLLKREEIENIKKEELENFVLNLKQEVILKLSAVLRKGTDKLIDFLEKSSFFSDPASAYYHNSIHGGLLLHSCNVFEIGNKMNVALNLGIEEESIFLVSLIHDFCKIGNYKIDTRRKQNPLYKNDPTKKYGWYDASIYRFVGPKADFGHGSTSLYYILKKVGADFLTETEELAITHHMGPWESENAKKFGNIAEQNPLLLLLHSADTWAGLHYEVRGPVEHLIF